MEFITEFETLSLQISLSTVDLTQKLKEKMSKEYLTQMLSGKMWAAQFYSM